MSLYQYIVKREKTFLGAVPVKYLFLPADNPCDKLIVVFSGFSGTEKDGQNAFYNYPKSLMETNINRLFILDSLEKTPCYYLGKNGTFEYESTVVSLISYVANLNNISHKDIITAGSSKGGTAAIYFGMKYNFGHVIAGGMQTKVGSYLYDIGMYTRYVVLKHITGEFTEKGRDKLNDFYFNFFESAEGKPSLNLHIGKGDHHYKDHFLPFIELLDKRDIKYNLDIQEYDEHSKLGQFFPKFMLEQIDIILGNNVKLELTS